MPLHFRLNLVSLAFAIVASAFHEGQSQVKTSFPQTQKTVGGCSPIINENHGTIIFHCPGESPEELRRFAILLKSLSQNERTDRDRLLGKMQQVLDAAKRAQKEVNIDAPNGLVIAGDNNAPATVINNGPELWRITATQLQSLTNAVKPFSGQSISIDWEIAEDTTSSFARALKAALEAGGLKVSTVSPMMLITAALSRPQAGLTFFYQERDKALFEAIVYGLAAAGFPIPPSGFSAYPMPLLSSDGTPILSSITIGHSPFPGSQPRPHVGTP